VGSSVVISRVYLYFFIITTSQSESSVSFFHASPYDEQAEYTIRYISDSHSLFTTFGSQAVTILRNKKCYGKLR